MLTFDLPPVIVPPQYGGWPFQVTNHWVTIPHLPLGFEGVTIAHFSDIHVDRWNGPVLDKAMDWLASCQPDMIVCTGDTIHRGSRYITDLQAILSRSHAPMGKFFCMGNHDYMDGAGGQKVRRAIEAAGYEVLINEARPLEKGGQRLWMMGADDYKKGKQCLRSTVQHRGQKEPAILLSHNPKNFKEMAQWEPDLILSGHTHGGQIRFPLPMRQWISGSHFLEGAYTHGKTRLYVTRGLGSSAFFMDTPWYDFSLPAPRIEMDREVVLHHLHSTSPRMAQDQGSP